MKRKVRNLIAAAAGCFLLAGLTLPAQATHTQGAELTYTCVAPNTYLATLKIYRDCQGAQAPQAATLQVKAPGCNNGRPIAMTKSGNSRLGTDYCAQLGTPTCSSTGNPNYEEITFVSTVTFSAAEAQCADWVLSWSLCCWPNLANVPNAQSYNDYAEAHLKLGTAGTVTANLNNSSPQFVAPITRFINQNQPIMLSSLAVDPDGDSLVYSLQPLLSNTGSPIPFGSYSPPGGMLINPQDSTQIAYVAPVNQTLSATFPIPSYFVDWTQPAPRYATKSFVLDAQNGTLLFTAPPMASSPPNIGANKYVFVVQVDEYRKLGGTAVKIGSVRREVLMTIIDCGPNNNPLITAPTANGQILSPGSVINLRPGTPLTFTFAADDNNTSDVLTLSSDAGTVLPGSSLVISNSSRPSGSISWTPTAADVREQLYFFRIMVEDDACPVKGQRVETYAVKVSNNGRVTSTNKDLKPQAAFTAYPNPFGNHITFKVNQTQPTQLLLIYNVLGQQVDQISLKGQLNTEQEVTWLNAPKFPAGQYLVRFSGSAGQSIRINKLQ